jgi:MoxR-like ATPase
MQVSEQPISARFDLLERGAERAAVERLIGPTQAGFHLLALEGPPGIGKTALIAETKAAALEAGMQRDLKRHW